VGEVEEEGLSLSELIAREVKSEKDQFSNSSKNSSQNTNNNTKKKIMTRFTGLGAKGVVIFQSPPPIPSSNDVTKEEEEEEKEVEKEEREEDQLVEDQVLNVVDLTFKIFNQVSINPNFRQVVYFHFCDFIVYLDERERAAILSIYFQSFSHPIDLIFNHFIHHLNSSFFPSCSIYSTK